MIIIRNTNKFSLDQTLRAALDSSPNFLYICITFCGIKTNWKFTYDNMSIQTNNVTSMQWHYTELVPKLQ